MVTSTGYMLRNSKLYNTAIIIIFVLPHSSTHIDVSSPWKKQNRRPITISQTWRYYYALMSCALRSSPPSHSDRLLSYKLPGSRSRVCVLHQHHHHTTATYPFIAVTVTVKVYPHLHQCPGALFTKRTNMEAA